MKLEDSKDISVAASDTNIVLVLPAIAISPIIKIKKRYRLSVQFFVSEVQTRNRRLLAKIGYRVLD